METTKKKDVLVDVMLVEGNRFLCQLRYSGMPFPTVVDGKVTAGYDYQDIARFIESKRPSLANKKYYFVISNQQVLNK